MICGFCGKKIESGEPCFQIRAGNLDDDGDFIADQDYAYHCADCGVETGNFVSR